MSVTTPLTAEPAVSTPTRSLPRTTLVVGAIAATITTAAAAALQAVGVSYAIDGETIPILGFAQMTFVGAVLGGLLLAVLNRTSRHARTRFVQAAVMLTAVSCVPSVTMPDDVGTQIALVALHVLAAAIIVAVLARYARD